VRGFNDLLVLTQPAAIEHIHYQFLEAGADIVETNTFGANAIAAEDYKFAAHIVDLNVAAAQVARRAAERAERADGKPRFVAGSIGPTTKTASLSPDVNDPGAAPSRSRSSSIRTASRPRRSSTAASICC
jgi:5-methyltetrahydrofolate--homocysteine methyltransferase